MLINPNSEVVGMKNLSHISNESPSTTLWVPIGRGNKKIRLTLPSPLGRGDGGEGAELNPRIPLRSVSEFGFRNWFWLSLALALSFSACSQSKEKESQQTTAKESAGSTDSFLGRWDLAVKTETGEYPSWLEISKEGDQLKGRFVGKSGSARPIAQIAVKEGQLEFSLPKQYEERSDDLVFKGRLGGEKLEGTTTSEEGKTLQWTGVHAPSLERSAPPEWGEPMKLFNGKELTGWKVRSTDKNGWKAIKSVLVNTPPSSDLISEQAFEDFKLHLEFNIPEKSNSGVYLRGRYEVQIEDGYGLEPESHRIGGVYGFLTPSTNPSKKAGQWQSYDITLVGRKVTVALNGKTIIDNQEIPGITGGALNSNEGTAGPIFLQGDHGKVSYRNIVLTPTKK